ncbi:MAG: 6-bladed beta-propeller [Tannerella sp.]|jgi:hypothetical protein|nr:6-bladed beta-propeller [Tannerella sp.]
MSSYGATEHSDAAACLSAIACKVTAIPLETNAAYRIDRPEKVVCAGNSVFVLCNNLIYRFNRNGKFRNRIAVGDDGLIRDYAICPEREQVMALDHFRRIHIFTFDGVEQKQYDLRAPTDGYVLQYMAYHSHSLWFIFEHLSSENIFENGLLRFGLADESVERLDLPDVNLGRNSLHRHFTPRFAVAENVPYVYSPFSDKAHILRDTLYLLAHGQFDDLRRSKEPVRIYPVHIGSRYLIAARCENVAEQSNFLFVYDRQNHISLDMSGLRDDFFRTGIVTDLQPLDMDGHEYYFYKTGKDTSRVFPGRGERDNPVLFFVHLS